MQSKKSKKIETFRCDRCGNVFFTGNTNGAPNGVSMEKNGKWITFCQKCIMELGAMEDAEKEKFFAELGYEYKGE